MRWIILLLALVLTACATGEPPAVTREVVLPALPQGQINESSSTEALPPPYPDAQVAPTEALDAAYPAPGSETLAPGRVVIEAADGLALVGTYAVSADASQPGPGVLLLHMLGSDRTAWAAVTVDLTAAGYAVLALDMRGHGETGGDLNWDLAQDDLLRAWGFLSGLPEVDENRTAVIGASIGANMALITGAAEPAIRTVILLSPGLDYNGLATEPAMAAYGGRPLLVVASQDDAYAATSSQTLIEQATGLAELKMYTGSAHGTSIFAPNPELTLLILEWLNEHTK